MTASPDELGAATLAELDPGALLLGLVAVSLPQAASNMASADTPAMAAIERNFISLPRK